MDAELLERLYREHSQAAILYCTALSGDEELAQDLTADAFVKAYLTLPENVPSFRYWLLRVCRNLWIDHLRKHRREVRNLPVERLATGVTPESRLLRNERSRCLWNAIASLPPPGRELVTLHYFSGVPLEEAAGLLGISYSAARQRMVRLRRTLRQRMEEQGYDF